MRFDAKTLKLMRETAELSMTSVLVRVTVPQVDDGKGGYTLGTPVEGTATKCRIAPQMGLGDAIERVLGGRVESRNRFRVFAPYNFQAEAGDRLKVDSSTYEIEAARSPASPDVIETVWDVYLSA
jgi:tagatose-1,6-bisphosphate aldolase non-catalytic subunit AgaZ/GatZ